jgi:aminoglycoside phosphotransferase family enzyme/predicted kinase
MTSGDQAAVIDFLGTSSTHGGLAVERIETHSAIVFLAGARAWKLKRAVRFDYLDFSTPARRKDMCEAEVRLNRRTAPALYHGVTPVTREQNGTLALGGSGTPIDWVVEMSRFDQEALLDRLAAGGQLSTELMPSLATTIARFHQAAQRRGDHGGSVEMRRIIQGNADGFAEYGAQLLDPGACDRVTAAHYAETERWGALLDARRASGFVRQCHGDLHLRNIVLLDGEPTLFDAIEFNDGIACIDVLYDLAFLLMDLWRRRLMDHANVVWNSYLSATDDLDGVSLMPLFLSCRAAVRAKTSATASRMQSDAARAGELSQMSTEYLTMAERLVQPPRPVLVAIGGLSGSGKSVLAKALAPSIGAVPGAIVLRSDEIRKRLCGVGALERLGPEGYTSEISGRVYVVLAEQARRAVLGGQTVVADAVHARPEERARIRRVANDLGVPFVGVWLSAPEATLVERTASRRLDVSDADEQIVRRQLAQDPGTIDWCRVDASGSPGDVLGRVAHCVENVVTP